MMDSHISAIVSPLPELDCISSFFREEHGGGKSTAQTLFGSTQEVRYQG